MARRPRSLRLELLVTLTVVVVMAVVSLSLTGELLGRWRHEAQQHARLVEHTRSLAVIVGPLLDPGAPAGLRGGPVEQVLRASVGSMGIEAIEVHHSCRAAWSEPRPHWSTSTAAIVVKVTTANTSAAISVSFGRSGEGVRRGGSPSNGALGSTGRAPRAAAPTSAPAPAMAAVSGAARSSIVT